MLFKKGKGHDSPVIPAPNEPKKKKTPKQIAWAIFKFIFAPKNWKLFIIFVPLFVHTTKLLRADHIRMTELREAVISADRTEDDTKIIAALDELKDFVFSNVVINIVDDNGNKNITFGTGPFYLEHMYMRAAADALEKTSQTFESDNNPNGNIYKEASLTCKDRAIKNGWTWDNPNFINCMVTEIEKYPSSGEIQDTLIAAIPPTDLYRKNYASPAWAPTPTGWFMLATAVLIVVIFIRIFIWIVYGIALLFA